MPNNKLHFTKMHGLGNDFIIIVDYQNQIDSTHLPIAKLANRYTGIGFDQLLVIKPSQKAHFLCHFFNADGSQAEQCGNGLRCIARFIHENKLVTDSSLQLETQAGIHSIVINNYDHIQVMMGKPTIHEPLFELNLNNSLIPLSALSLGNPHAIVKVTDLSAINTQELGMRIANHAYFPQGANVGFMQIINDHHILLRTFERGSGETFACGSNACAAVVAGITNHWLTKHVKVEYQYGSLFIDWQGIDQPIYMTGPAEKVFTGEVDL